MDIINFKSGPELTIRSQFQARVNALQIFLIIDSSARDTTN